MNFLLLTRNQKSRYDYNKTRLADELLARGRGVFPIKRMGVLAIPLVVKEAVSVPLRLFSIERSTAGAFVVPFEYGG